MFPDGKVFASLIYYQDQFSGQFMAKLEDRISEVIIIIISPVSLNPSSLPCITIIMIVVKS